jgi:hypothetical protein
MKNKTINDLRSAIKTWLDKNLLITNASAHFYADNQWIELWNTEEVEALLNTGSKWTVTVAAPYTTSDYVQLKISTYGDQKVYYACCRSGKWEEVHQVAFADSTVDSAEFTEQINFIYNQMNNYIPKQDVGGMYVIDTPLNIKTNSKDNYFINKSGDSSLNIRSDVANGTASLNLGQNSKSKYGLRVRPNTDDPNEPPRFDIYDYVGNKSIAILKSVEEIKIDAQEDGNVNSGMYIGGAKWTNGIVGNGIPEYRLFQAIHDGNLYENAGRQYSTLLSASTDKTKPAYALIDFDGFTQESGAYNFYINFTVRVSSNNNYQDVNVGGYVNVTGGTMQWSG